VVAVFGGHIKGYLYGYVVKGTRGGLSEHVYVYVGYCD
jgi:hypothetical protein